MATKQREFIARYDGRQPCVNPECGKPIEAGQLITGTTGQYRHADCAMLVTIGKPMEFDELRAVCERRPDLMLKLNPEVERHIGMEQDSCGDGYTRAMARDVVLNEFGYHMPLPQQCECGGVMWYRSTASVMKCQSCGKAGYDLEYPDL